MSRRLNNDKVAAEIDLKASQAEKTINELITKTDELRKINAEHRKEITRLAATEGDHSAEIKRLNEQIRINNSEITNSNNSIRKEREGIDLSRKSASDLKKELRELNRKLATTSKALHPEEWRKTEIQIQHYNEALRQAQEPTRSLWEKFKNLPSLAKVVEGGLLAIGSVVLSQVTGAFKNLLNTIQDFERQNSRLASVLGVSVKEISSLTEQAKYLGRTTTATASQVTGLQTELAKLGFSQEVIEKLTPSTLKFAKAVDTDLSRAAAFAGAAMRMFDKDASEAESVMASFAVATTKSALDFNKLEASLSTVGPVANSFGFSIEATTALLGQLSNAGFDASSAATATRNILLNLADSNGALAQALGGPVKNLDELVAGMKKLKAEGIDLAKALELTDKRSVAAFSTFLNGADNILALRDSITGCTGDFKQMSVTMGDNAVGSWAGFQSAVEGLVLKFSDLTVALQTLYGWATDFVNWIGSFVDAMAPMGEMLAYVAGAIGSAISAIGEFTGWLSRFITQTKAGRIILNVLVTGLVTYKTATLLAAVATKTFTANVMASAKAGLLYIKGIKQKIGALIADTKATETATVATESFNTALEVNPIMLFVSVIAMAITGLIAFNSTVEESTEKTDAWTDASREASRQYGEQKGKIEALIMVAENENISLKRRQQAIAELNRIIPGYNAKIDETTLKYSASKEALDAYLTSLEKEIRYKANEGRLQELAAAAEMARDAYDEALIAAQNAPKYIDHWWGKTWNSEPEKAVKEAKAAYDQAESDFKGFKSRMEKAMENGVISPVSDTVTTVETAVTQPLAKANAAATETVTRLKEINAELKKLRKTDPEDDDEFDRIRKRIDQLTKEKRALMGSSSRKKHERGTYAEDSIDEVSAPYDDAYQRKLLEINKKDIPAIEKTIQKNEELIKYCKDLNTALDEMKGNVKTTHKQTLDAINTQQNKLAQQALSAQQAIDKAKVQQDSETHSRRKEANEAYYRQQTDLIKASVAEDQGLQEASSIYLMELERQTHEEQLKELKRYYAEVSAADYYSKDEKTKLLQQTGKEIQQLQSQILTDTGKFSETLRAAMTDTTSMDGVRNNFQLQISSLKMYYAALKKPMELGKMRSRRLIRRNNAVWRL